MTALGITGHRPNNLPAGWQATLPRDLGALLAALKRQAGGALRVETGLAAGADSAAALAALALGIPVTAVLPFARDTYADDFTDPAEQETYRDLLEAARQIVELPGRRAEATEAYSALGQTLTRRCDILIAIWDGKPGRGAGGTADVVRMARSRGIPVILVTPGEGENAVTLLGDGDLPADAPGRSMDEIARAVLPPAPSPLQRAQSKRATGR